MRRFLAISLLLALGAGCIACTGVTGGVYYGRRGYYGPRPWGGWGYGGTVIIDRYPDIDPDIDAPIAVPLPEPPPDMGMPDFGPMDMGGMDMGGFDMGGFDGY